MSIIPADDLTPTQISERTKHYADNSRSESTKRAYLTDWAAFSDFCRKYGHYALPAMPSTISDFLSEQAERFRPATLERRLAAISVRHKKEGYPSPCNDPDVLETLRGIKRDKGTRPKKKKPLRVEQLRKIISALGFGPIDHRNRAMILLGYAGGFRRSELVGLDWEDVEFVDEGAKVLVRKSKTDQEGRGFVKFIPFGSSVETCPVRSLKTWKDIQSLYKGPVFTSVSRWGNMKRDRLTPKGVARTVKRLAESVGLDATEYAAHSLRSGLVTDGYAHGVAESDIAAMTGHKSRAVLESYRQEADGFKRNVAGSVGL